MGVARLTLLFLFFGGNRFGILWRRKMNTKLPVWHLIYSLYCSKKGSKKILWPLILPVNCLPFRLSIYGNVFFGVATLENLSKNLWNLSTFRILLIDWNFLTYLIVNGLIKICIRSLRAKSTLICIQFIVLCKWSCQIF